MRGISPSATEQALAIATVTDTFSPWGGGQCGGADVHRDVEGRQRQRCGHRVAHGLFHRGHFATLARHVDLWQRVRDSCIADAHAATSAATITPEGPVPAGR